jgi:hypothetical protein
MEKTVRLSISGSFGKDFFLYKVTEEDALKPEFRMDPSREIIIKDKKEIVLKLPAKSIYTLTNMHVMHNEQAANK